MKYFLMCIIVLTIFSAHAQTPEGGGEGQEPTGSEFGIHTGPLLPNQIDGMSEIQPMWGLRYGTSFKKGMLEASLANSRAEGVIYYNGFLSYRYDVTLEEVTGIIFAGLDLHQWSSPPDDSTRMVAGGHIGGGMMLPIGDAMWFRSEMKFNLNPGTALYIGFGLVLRFPDGGGDAE